MSVTPRLLIALLSLTTPLLGCGNSVGGGFTTPGSAPMLSNPTHVWDFAPDDVWILDGTSTIHRFDGANWSTLTAPTMNGLGCIFALSNKDVWLCAGSTVLHWDGTTFTTNDAGKATGVMDLVGIWASSPMDLFAVGSDATVAHFDGTSWTRTIAGSPFKASLWGSGPKDVYALDTFGLSHFDGASWSMVNNVLGGQGQVWGTSASDVWVMPASNSISHFDGMKWTSMDVNLVGELAAVWGAAPSDLWAVGSGGEIAHYDGASWSEVSHQPIGAPYLSELVAVHGSSAHDIWIVGHQLGNGGSTGLVYHRTQ